MERDPGSTLARKPGPKESPKGLGVMKTRKRLLETIRKSVGVLIEAMQVGVAAWLLALAIALLLALHPAPQAQDDVFVNAGPRAQGQP